jgi:UDP-glucose 4-epimerase
MHILVTGGNGFIGSHLVDMLVESPQHKVVVFDLYPREYEPLPTGVVYMPGNLSDVGLVRRTLVDQGIEVVYHLAWATIHESALKNPTADVEQNLLPTLNLLDACRDSGVKKVLFASSGGTVYGIPDRFPVHEDQPTNPINAYGVSKLAVEKYLQMYQYLYGLDYVIFRPSVPYGPRQNPRRRQGAVSVFTYKVLNGEQIDIWGDGDIMRDYLFIKDMVRAFVDVIDLPDAKNTVMNLAGAKSISLNNLVEVIERALNKKANVRYTPGRKFDVPELKLDIQTAARIINWYPETTLAEGISRTAEWILKWID